MIPDELDALFLVVFPDPDLLVTDALVHLCRLLEDGETWCSRGRSFLLTLFRMIRRLAGIQFTKQLP